MIDQAKIHQQCFSDDQKERIEGLKQLRDNFSLLPDKQQAWNDLIKLTSDRDDYVRYQAASNLGSVFSQVPDKQQAWNDLHRLTNDENNRVRYQAVSAFGSVFSQVPDKQQAWNDLHRLTNDENNRVRYRAASTLGSVYSQVPDKQQAWNDLHRLTNDENSDVRYHAASALGSVFSQVPDKQQAWEDLRGLANGENWGERYQAAFALGSVFSQVRDKRQAWNDLHRLTKDENRRVRYQAASALGSVFSQVPDKQQAWNDLHRLTKDKEIDVRFGAASALGSAFAHLQDKQQAWNDLHRLTSDQDRSVRIRANHSLGEASIFQASQAEIDEDYKKELEKAIEFFEKAAQDSTIWNNPSQFCLSFYRSFYSIVFKKQEAKEELDKYLKEAKGAIKGSKSKETLLEAVENLANALKEVQDLKILNLDTKKNELNYYMQYCNRASELMKHSEEVAPYATGVLRKGLPILDKNLKELLEEIKIKAEIVCKESKNTDIEEIACLVNNEVQEWRIGNQEEMALYVKNLIVSLKSKIPDIPENEHIYDRIKTLENEKVITRQYEILPTIILSIPQVNINQKIQNVTINVPETTEPKSFSKKIINSIIISIGIAGSLLTLSYPICEKLSLVNQNNIFIEVFTFFFLLSMPIVFFVVEK